MTQAAFAREPLAVRRRLLEAVAHALVEDDGAIAGPSSRSPGKPLAEAYVHDLIVAADACTWLAANLEASCGRSGSASRSSSSGTSAERSATTRSASSRSSRRGTSRSRSRFASGRRRRGRQRRRPQAVGADAAERRLGRGALPARRSAARPRPRRPGPRRDGRRRARPASRDRRDRLHRLDRGREVGRAGRGRPALPRRARARRKDPMLVLDDADLDRAVEGACGGRSRTAAGVRRDRADRGRARAARRVRRAAHGARRGAAGRPRSDPDVELGPLVSRSSARASRSSSRMRSSTARRSRAAAAAATTLPGWFHEPTVLVGEPRTRGCGTRSSSVRQSSLSRKTTTR